MSNNYITPSGISALKYVDQSSRYASSTVEYYSTTIAQYITFETYKRKPPVLSPNDTFTVLSKKYEYRPDRLANDVYNDPRKWWKILEANNIQDIYDFKAGINIRLPALII